MMKKTKKKKTFAGNGLSRTAMLFKIALIAGQRLTVVEMKKIPDVNARSLERVYDEVVRQGDKGSAALALSMFLK